MFNCPNCHELSEAIASDTGLPVCYRCGANVENIIYGEKNQYLTKEEIKLLNEFFSNQYISYENIPLLELIRKISAIANE